MFVHLRKESEGIEDGGDNAETEKSERIRRQQMRRLQATEIEEREMRRNLLITFKINT